MEIEAKIVANAKEDAIQFEEGKLRIKVCEQPEKGKANKAVEKLLKNKLGCKAQILSGATSNRKKIRLECTEQELVKTIGDINGKNVH